MSLILKVRKTLPLIFKKKACITPFKSCCMFQAAYNVGGHTVNVDMIQSYILGCRLLRPGQVNMLL